MKKLRGLLALGAMLSLSAQAFAGTAFYNGALTTASPTYDNPGGSAAGTGIHYYSVQPFTVDLTGAYTFEMASPNTTGTPSNALDTFLALYANVFNPLAPGAPLASNDDFTGALTVLPGPFAPTVGPAGTGFTGAQPASRLLNINLTAGTSYFLINTSFRETTFVGTGTTSQSTGAWYTGISGPGNIIIPAPGALALLGLAGVVGSRRRRR